MRWQAARDPERREKSFAIVRRRFTEASRKQPAKAAQTRKTNRHAYVGDGAFTKDKHLLGPLEPDSNSELMRGLPEHSSKAPN